MEVSVVIGQFPIELNIEKNLKTILSILEQAEEEDLVVLPEGALSGYSDDISFLEVIDWGLLEHSLELLRDKARQKHIHLVFGSCIFEDDKWYNAGICFTPSGEKLIYRKVNLATHERGYIEAGTDLPIYSLSMKGNVVNVGIQLCRELRFPEQWRWMALNGAEIFIYLTNVGETREEFASVWRSQLISRAVENQRFLISVNNAVTSPICPSAIISPVGHFLRECESLDIEVIRANIELDEISNWYINQCRNDIVKLVRGDIQ